MNATKHTQQVNYPGEPAHGPLLNPLLPNVYVRVFSNVLGSRPELFESTGQSTQTLAQVNGMITYDDYCQFFRNARILRNKPDIGIYLGQINQLSNLHGPLGIAVLNAKNLKDAMLIMDKYASLQLPVATFRFVEGKTASSLEVHLPKDNQDIVPSVSETLLLSIVRLFSAICGDHPAESVCVNYPPPPYSSEYRRSLSATSFQFNSDCLRITYSNDALMIANFLGPDPSLRHTSLDRCTSLMRDTLDKLSIQDSIKNIFADNPGHLWTVSEIAGYLSMSRRTLQRRLLKSGASFRDLQTDWVMTEAHKLVVGENISIESVALLLGYSDVSNFRKAFIRQFQQTPAQAREAAAKLD